MMDSETAPLAPGDLRRHPAQTWGQRGCGGCCSGDPPHPRALRQRPELPSRGDGGHAVKRLMGNAVIVSALRFGLEEIGKWEQVTK